MLTTTTTNTSNFGSTTFKYSVSGVYEYIIYTLEKGEIELLYEGKIFADSEQNAKDKVLFEFAKSEEGEDYDLEDFNIQVRLF